MAIQQVVIKQLANFKNSHVKFTVGAVEDTDQFVLVAEQGSVRIVLAGGEKEILHFLEGAAAGVRNRWPA